MNNVKSLSIILLLSLGAVGSAYAAAGMTGTDGCSTSATTGCNDCCSFSTFFRPRQVIADLTLRNNLSYYNRTHDARSGFFTWDNTIFVQQNRDAGNLGAGFFGKNPLVFGETPANTPDFNSNNIGLGNINRGANPANTTGFKSTVSVCPERDTVGWLSQLFFNFDCFCTGMWADLSFAVVRAKHTLNFNEVLGTTGQGTIPNNPKTVKEAFSSDNLNVFANIDGECSETRVDDVMFRFGYDYNWCNNDSMGLYFLAIAPTGDKDLDQTQWFQPIVGNRHAAVGAGLRGDYSVWCCEMNNSEVVLQTELLYQYRIRRDDNRIFDYNNGTWSRGLAVVKSNARQSPLTKDGYNALKSCVRVEPRHQIEWWANVHYQYCNWGTEFSYNLWWRDRENIECSDFNFGTGDNALAIADLSNQICGQNANPTSGSKNKICTLTTFGQHDAQFTPITASNVNLCSGAAQRVLTHKISFAAAYNNVWCECYPWYAGVGGGYEFASKEDRCHALENWHFYGKVGLSW